ncbi:MAG: ZIP family metal transporter [Candidatus Omnitrophica bacterium]|nr:ZIP family metal transporter [Candidatus Omnitrophota bacterium]MDD5653293.1 ZIP family metal transporter [Candidatus Omnitrophota bacterium]
MANFIWAVSASVVVSSISLIGIFTLLLKDKLLQKILFLLISFSAGGLIGGAFLHLLPEALENSASEIVFSNLIIGFIFFFILEKYLHWRHCHNGVCSVHVFTYLNLFGDGVHNFIDGLVIGSSFLISVHFGVVTALVIIFHEIPQEIGDFGVLVYGGFSKLKALYYNFLTALTCIAGTICGFFLSENIANFTHLLLPFTAGGFIYIGACDLIPEIHKQSQSKKSVYAIVTFILGIIFIILARAIGNH